MKTYMPPRTGHVENETYGRRMLQLRMHMAVRLLYDLCNAGQLSSPRVGPHPQVERLPRWIVPYVAEVRKFDHIRL